MKINTISSQSPDKSRTGIPKLLPISSVSGLNQLNSTFHTNQNSNRNQLLEKPFKTHHQRFLSSSRNFNKEAILNFSSNKEKSTSTLLGSRSQNSRPMSSFLGSFHADKTQQDFLKHQKDPIFREFNSLIQKSKPNSNNPFEDVVVDFREKKQKKQREMIFYLRKMNYAKVLMKDLVNEFKKFDMSSPAEKEIYLNHIQESWGNSIQVFTSISNILNCLIQNAYDRDVVNVTLAGLIQESQNLKIYQLNLLCLLFYAKCCIVTRDFLKAISLFKQAKSIAHSYSNTRLKLKCYKGLGVCCQIMKKYVQAKHYFLRVLQLSWAVGDKQNELLAYDSIGLQYYYLGDVEQAQYFHFKMMRGEYENEKSDLRALGIKKLGLSKELKKNKIPLRKETSLNEIPENPLFNISSDEEDFEITVPRDQLKKSLNFDSHLQKDKGEYSRAPEFRLNPNNSNGMREILLKKANESMRYKSMQIYECNKIKKINQMKAQKHMVSLKFSQNNPTINSKIILSHLTPNKSVNFFHNSIAKTMEIDADEESSSNVFNKLDGRALHKIVKKAKYFNANILFTVKNVKTILSCVGLAEND